MTTNKPGVVGYVCENDPDSATAFSWHQGICSVHSCEEKRVAVVRMTDYDSLLAQHESLQADYVLGEDHRNGMADQIVSLRTEVGALKSSRDQLQTECEELRRDAERYRFIRDAEELPMNLMRLEMIGDVMDSAIDAAMQDQIE